MPDDRRPPSDRHAVGRVLYVQYCNPAAYPPIEHGSQLLADAGFDVILLGTDVPGETMRMPPHPRIRVSIMPARGSGLRQKLLYARYMMWVLAWSLRLRPAWVYASDPLSCPVALVIRVLLRTRTIYHEHDSPEPGPGTTASVAMRLALAARQRVARISELCVLPNSQRADLFTRSTGRTNLVTVWNCPTRGEAAASRDARKDGELRVLYQGSIVPARVPATMLHALTILPREITLTVIGFETLGHYGYSRELQREADRLGVGNRVRFEDPLSRSALMERIGEFDVGVVLLSQLQPEVNRQTMVGASNKAFDYMARGLALLVTDLPDWRMTYVLPGFGVPCHPDSAESIRAALLWLWKHRAEREAMGLKGRQRILDAWNYERMFAPVLEHMTNTGNHRSVGVVRRTTPGSAAVS